MKNTLIYKGIENVLLARFPELGELLEKTFGSYYDLKRETPGAYSVFEGVLQESLFKLLDTREGEPSISRIFSFLEEMANSHDKEVVNLLWIAVLVPLVFKRERIRRAWKYMGSRTRELAREIARSRGWQENLPPDETTSRNGQ
jgi:hypothetical protein